MKHAGAAERSTQGRANSEATTTTTAEAIFSYVGVFISAIVVTSPKPLLVSNSFSTSEVSISSKSKRQLNKRASSSKRVSSSNSSKSASSEKFEKPQDIWGLGLAVVTAVVQSLGDSSSGTAIVESMMPYYFSEKAHLIFNSLDVPDFPSEDHDKKRLRAQRSWISFAILKETEHTLLLLCELAKHWNSWIRGVKNVEKQLREKCIHLLAFISRGSQRLGESSSKSPPLLCPPTVKHDFEICSKPSYINSRNGWFALSPLGCVPKPKISSFSTAISIYGQATESTGPAPKTCFSDPVAIQLYRIAFLLLKFLCLQAEGAAKRAEEVGFVDLAHFVWA